ncbi:type 12 methyltransferase [Nitzschia inconspicua]|uniref:Type 12 methyltransferase n=1 Tax=Nitzschia inconspicua TaxID=303405 RepID=A0A9K3KY55_9STRA|nr:type 12 methyltransferase [Nitzschia inconspicua]
MPVSRLFKGLLHCWAPAASIGTICTNTVNCQLNPPISSQMSSSQFKSPNTSSTAAAPPPPTATHQKQQDQQQQQPFSDPHSVSNYKSNVIRQVPGYEAMQTMALVLLEESIYKQNQIMNNNNNNNNNNNDDDNACTKKKILVVGAGGGLELLKFGTAHVDDWTMVGVDPSPEMLQLAKQTTHSLRTTMRTTTTTTTDDTDSTTSTAAAATTTDNNNDVNKDDDDDDQNNTMMTFYQGYVTDPTAPKGPFDGATCLLTLHFLPKPERLATLRAIYQSLNHGAPLIVVHHSVDTTTNTEPITNQNGDRAPDTVTGTTINPLLMRYAAYTAHTSNGNGNNNNNKNNNMSTEQASRIAQTIQDKLPLLSPNQDEDLLRQAGFQHVQLFYAAFTFRGWVAYK